MPMVQYAHPSRSINIVKNMPTPVRVSSEDAWFKQARRTIDQIPEGWTRVTELITEKTIVFQLIHPRTHEKCAVVIARKQA